MKLEDNKTYLNGHGHKVRVSRRPEIHRTIWKFVDQHGDVYAEDGKMFLGMPSNELVSEYVVDISRPDGVKMSLPDIEADIKEAKRLYGSRELSFTWVTVEALVNKIKELEGVK
jgi:hypothetical protein